MKRNYEAWEIDLSEFDALNDNKEKVQFLLRFASLAPSSHNSQPWKFKIPTENSIEVYADTNRALPNSDKNHRQLILSIGCAIKNILVAADYFGFKAELFLENNLTDANIFLSPLATIKFSSVRSTANDKDHLIHYILKRHANRFTYSDRSPDSHFLEKIKSLSTNNVRIDIISVFETRKQIADCIINAGIAAMNDNGFRKELSQYVKNNYTHSYVGMPLEGFGVPGAISLIAPFLMSYINMNKINQKDDRKTLMSGASQFLLINSSEDGPRTWLNVGLVIEEVWLEAAKYNIDMAVYGAPIQIGEYYKDLQKILGTDLRPQFCARFGYSEKSFRLSPRLPVKNIFKN